MNQPKPTIAAFDFDGTLTRLDSLVPFLLSSFGFWKTASGLLCELPAMGAFLVGLKSRQATKERLLSRYLKGIPKEALQKMGANFAEKPIQKILKADRLEMFYWHQAQGHRCILISASIEIYLEPWAKAMRFQDLICSRLAFDAQGCATGLLEGRNCWGEEKTRRLLELLGPREGFILYAYGDSTGDRELLALADYPTKL